MNIIIVDLLDLGFQMHLTLNSDCFMFVTDSLLRCQPMGWDLQDLDMAFDCSIHLVDLTSANFVEGCYLKYSFTYFRNSKFKSIF